MPQDPATMRAGAAYARARRTGDPATIAKTRTALNEAKVQAWVERTLAEAPPHLTEATRSRLARLLAGGDR